MGLCWQTTATFMVSIYFPNLQFIEKEFRRVDRGKQCWQDSFFLDAAAYSILMKKGKVKRAKERITTVSMSEYQSSSSIQELTSYQTLFWVPVSNTALYILSFYYVLHLRNFRSQLGFADIY